MDKMRTNHGYAAPGNMAAASGRPLGRYENTDCRYKIELGDRIFARLTMGGKTIVEFMINTVADMTQLISELRHTTSGKHGLAMLYIRNQSRGWSRERPLMLYSAQSGRKAAPVYASMSPFDRPSDPGSGYMQPAHVTFPWETH